ncbi:MAG: DUF1376 domain-containing protein [Nitrobacter sp.]
MNPPKMPIHIGDLLRDTSHLRADGMGAYLLLMFHHWSTGELPDDDQQLATIARLSPSEWKRARPVMEKFFQPGWKHGRIEKDLASSHANYEKRAKAGSEGGKAKAAAKQNSSKNVAMLESETGNALATFNLLPKTDGASAPQVSNPETELFRRGKEILGRESGGLIKNLLKAKNGDFALARAAIEVASTKSNAREYVGGVIRAGGQQQDSFLDPQAGIM